MTSTTLAILARVHSKPCIRQQQAPLRGLRQARESGKCHRPLRQHKVKTSICRSFHVLSKNWRCWTTQNIESLVSMLAQKVPKKQSGAAHPVSINRFNCFISSVDELPTGYQNQGRFQRCTDRFVRYPYPKNVFSNYKQNYRDMYKQTDIKNHKDAFNMEKESKIINPHKMDLSTTNKNVYKGRHGSAAVPKAPIVSETPKPIQQSSSYAQCFVDWNNGRDDVFHEKHPQYPYYSLPFQGSSTYAKSFSKAQIEELRRQKKLLQSSGKESQPLQLGSYQPQQFGFTTTNSNTFKDFRFVHAHTPERVKKCAPIVHPVQTKSLPGHFSTMNQNNFKGQKLANSVVDRIPYP